MNVLWRVTEIWIAAALIAGLLRRRVSAAHRHLVWTLAQTSALLVPLLFLALPPRRIEAPPQQIAVIAAPAAQVAVSAPLQRRQLPPALPLAWIWLAGASVVLGWTALGVLRVRWLSRRAVLFLVMEDGLPVRLSARSAAPFTWGSLRPEVVLPAGAERWDSGQLRLALLHETAHVRRRDWTVLMMSRLVCAIYWFHPLAWLASRELKRLSEHACDDSVLNQGVNPMQYTQQLLGLARLARPAALSTAIGMASSSGLEASVKAILNPRTRRGPVRLVEAGLASALALFLLIAASPVRGVAQSSGAVLIGVAHDATGAAVPGVTVTVSNAARQEITTTGDSGGYRFAGLLPGSYQLEARMPGFMVFRSTVNIQAGLQTQAPLDLSVGEVQEALEVTAKAPPPVPVSGRVPQRIRVGGTVQATRLIDKVIPVYPPDAQQRGVEGTVLLRAIIATDGSLSSLAPVNSLVDPELTKSAMDAVGQWRYEPTLLNGEPVQVVTNITVDFKLEH